jgi:hypothetical protein
MQKLTVIAAALVCAGFLASDALAQRGDRDEDRRERSTDRDRDEGRRDRWTDLGCRQVSFVGRDRDTIQVGRREGRFRAIRLTARGNDVEMLDLKVVYANGVPDDIQVRSVIRAGDRTRPLDLRGGDRSIRQIDMVYRSRPNFRGQATVCAEGLQA